MWLLRWVVFCHCPAFLPDFIHEFLGFQHLRHAAPGQDPALEFQEVVDGQGQDQGAVRQVLDLLARVPLPFPDEPGRHGVEFYPHQNVVVVRPVDAEMAADVRAEIKIGRNPEPLVKPAGAFDPGQAEGPDVAPQVAVTDHVPVPVEAHPVIGVNAAGDRLGALPGLVIHLQAVLMTQAGEDGVPHLWVHVRGGLAQEAEMAEVVAAARDQFVRQGVLDFLEDGAEIVVDRCSFILGQHLLREVDGEEVAFLERHRRQAEVLLGVVVTALDRVVLQRRVQLVAHVVQVSLDGLPADLPFLCQAAAVGEPAFPDLLVDEQEPVVLRLVFCHIFPSYWGWTANVLPGSL